MKNTKTKSIVALAIVLVLTVVFGIVGVTGMSFQGGLWKLLPWLPTTNADAWPQAISLGLDLRGGVHFLLQVDMRAALTKRADAIAADLRTQLRDKRIRHTGISRIGNDVEVSFATTEERDRANDLLRNTQPDLLLTLPEASKAPYVIHAELSQKAIQNVQNYALKQNISTLHNRINELGVAEPHRGAAPGCAGYG